MSAETCDTSVLVPALAVWHPDHEVCRDALSHGVAAVPSHVVLETYSVLTRLPAPHRIAARDAVAIVRALPFEPLALDAAAYGELVALAAGHHVRGGAVYDALIARTALTHGLRLLTRDRRARVTYDVLGVDYRIV